MNPAVRQSSKSLPLADSVRFSRAIQASLALYQQNLNSGGSGANSSPDSDGELTMALMLSEQQRREDEENLIAEQRVLEKVLELSLTEK